MSQDEMMHAAFVATRLWRYLNLYFLKPFDAVNDTLTASLLHRLDWSGEIVELGSGDGVYSYVMHGGAFPLWFDRYLMTDLSREDIYDTHQPNVLPRLKALSSPNIRLAVDAKPSHVAKIREIGFACNAVCAPYEALPIGSSTVDAMFFYTPHGLKSHEHAMQEAGRVLRRGGRMLILRYDSRFNVAFICHRLSRALPGRLGRYFERLDNGRWVEITNLAKTPEEWNVFFDRHGFRVRARHSGLSTVAWRVYDVQTRPILNISIRLLNAVPRAMRTALKLAWMVAWYPWLVLFYFLFSNEYVRLDGSCCYLVYEIEKM